MYINQIKLVQFRNYVSQVIGFHPKFNVITGRNGAGKTSILEAVYYLSMGKSCFSSLDKQIIHHEKDFFRLEGSLVDRVGEDHEVVVKNPRDVKKEILLSGVKIERLQEYIGKFPCVIIAPDDVYTLLDASEARRNFINNTIVQSDVAYLTAIMQYAQLLKQRNSLLKHFHGTKSFDRILLDTYTAQMHAPSQYIHSKRSEVVDILKPLFKEFYFTLSKGVEVGELNYESSLAEMDFHDMMAKNLDKDRILGRTSGGVHRDDIACLMDGRPLKTYGSQGQLKSFVLSLKLAQYAYLHLIKKEKPLILLDDIFDKLDPLRVKQLLEILSGDDFGQVIITDTQSERISTILDEINQTFSIFVIDKGKVIGQA